MSRKGTYKIQRVVRVVTAPSEYSGRLFEYEQFDCGHYQIKTEQRETAKMIREMFNMMSGTPQRRRCYECVTGAPVAPEISKEWKQKQEQTK